MSPLLIYHDNIPHLNLANRMSPIKPLKKYESSNDLDEELKNITLENLQFDKENPTKLPSLDTIRKLNSLAIPKMSNKVFDIEKQLYKIIDDLHDFDQNYIKLVEISLNLVHELHKFSLCQKLYTMKRDLLMNQLSHGFNYSTPQNKSEFSLTDYEE